MPQIGEPAPAFDAVTTQGMLRPEDFKGSWLILFSHSRDFTPVCTIEFIALAEILPKLQKRGVELLRLSKEVSLAYGMIYPSRSKTETVRCAANDGQRCCRYSS